MTSAVQNYVRCEVRRQLVSRGISVRPGRRLRQHAGLAQEMLPPEGYNNNERGTSSEAIHIDDLMGRCNLKRKVWKISYTLKLPLDLQKKLYKMSEGYSRNWTVVDLLQELDKALDGQPPTIQADITKRMKQYWGTVPNSEIALGPRGFGSRFLKAAGKFAWWELLGMALFLGAGAIIGYKLIEESTVRDKKGPLGAEYLT